MSYPRCVANRGDREGDNDRFHGRLPTKWPPTTPSWVTCWVGSRIPMAARVGVREGEELSVAWMAANVVHEGRHHLLDIDHVLARVSAGDPARDDNRPLPCCMYTDLGCRGANRRDLPRSVPDRCRVSGTLSAVVDRVLRRRRALRQLGNATVANEYSRHWFDSFLATIPDDWTAKEVAGISLRIPRPAFRKVLDVCCGTGRHAGLLAAAGYESSGSTETRRRSRKPFAGCPQRPSGSSTSGTLLRWTVPSTPP